MSAFQNITIDYEKCVGCKACSYACSTDLFRFHDKDGIRTFTFASLCFEDGTVYENYEKVCTTHAIKMTSPKDKKEIHYYQFIFPMVHCRICGTYFATQKMAEKVKRSLSERLKDLNLEWITLCPECKLQKEAELLVGAKSVNEFKH